MKIGKRKIVFVLGGIRSGKSAFACNQAKKYAHHATYIATANPIDKEMKKRIKTHKLNRPKHWQIIEEKIDLCLALNKVSGSTKIVIIDCINFWLANTFGKKWSEEKVLKHIQKFCSKLKNARFHSYIISNEVGMSLVPGNKLGRKFQEFLGKINQIIATKFADKVYLMVAGIPYKIT